MYHLEEWQFLFTIETPKAVAHDVIAEGLLWNTCISWAEENNFSLGGGVRPASATFGEDDNRWIVNFGFYTNLVDTLTSELDASRLWVVISKWCSDRGYRLVGGFGPIRRHRTKAIDDRFRKLVTTWFGTST